MLIHNNNETWTFLTFVQDVTDCLTQKLSHLWGNEFIVVFILLRQLSYGFCLNTLCNKN